ncbi:MAG: YjgP/YjgQ family permease [Bacteroidia bacterium]|nr:YjgP/YjgQ family permease [Bacteroidia bacterium]
MKKLDVYIIKKFLGTFFYAISLLIIIVIIFDISEKVDDFLERSAPLHAILFDYYLNFIPYFVNLFLYLFTFISVIFFTSKMASDTEIIAILSSGISYRRMLRPYFISALFLTLLSLLLSNLIIPKTNERLVDFEKNYLKTPRKDRANNIHMQADNETYYFIKNFNAKNDEGKDFTLEKINKNRGMYYRLTAEKIFYNSDSSNWTLLDYKIREIFDHEERIKRGKKMDTTLLLSPVDFTIVVEDLKEMNYMELRNFIRVEKEKGVRNMKKFEIEQHQRFSFPFATLILTLLGVSLSSRKVRGGIGMHLGLGIGLTFTFILFMQVSAVFATNGNLSPLLAAWIPNLIFILIAMYAFFKAPK